MLGECGFTFMFAPRYHPAMRNAAPVRRELGVRTIFNLLGPLTNPASATHLVVGVAREDLVERVGEALRALGARRGAVVHGSGGVDEIVGDGPTSIYVFDEQGAHLAHLEPAEFGIAEPLRTPVGGSVEAAHAAFLDVLGGAPSAASDVVAMNAAVVFYAIGRRNEAAGGLRARARLTARRRRLASLRTCPRVCAAWLTFGSNSAAARPGTTLIWQSTPARMPSV